MPMLGFIGLGTMGQPMALNLRKAGHPVRVFARNPTRTGPLLEAGATLADTPQGVAQATEIIFINVTDDRALESVLFGVNGLAAGLRMGAVVVDMGTTSPATTRIFAARLAERGATLLDAPVSGGEAGAKAGTLSIMVGGPETVFQQVLPLFRAMGQNIVHVGDTGAGQVAKACNQIVISAALLGVAEALTFAARQGVDAGRVRQALLGGSAYSKILEIHGQRMLEHNFKPGFKARLHQKDLGIVLDEVQKTGMALPATALAAQMMNALVGSGGNSCGGELDSSALIEVIQQLNRIAP